MEGRVSAGWMKLALRARICSECDPGAPGGDPCRLLDAHSCEPGCALFCQLPSLARLFRQHDAKPPADYEEFAIKLLYDSAANPTAGRAVSRDVARPDKSLNYAPEALAVLEKIALLLE